VNAKERTEGEGSVDGDTGLFDPGHPATHFRCEPDCPCTCPAPFPYEANAGIMCRNCWGMVKRKRVHRFETVCKAGGFTVLASRWDDLAEPGQITTTPPAG